MTTLFKNTPREWVWAGLAAIVVAFMFSRRTERFVHADTPGWSFAGGLVGGHEFNRQEFNVRDASSCRTQCTGSCLATEYIRDDDGSGNKLCIFYDRLDSSLLPESMPNDKIDGFWVRQ